MPKPPIELLDLRDQYRPDLLNAFIAIYKASFPDPSEREDPAQWPERLRRSFPSPQPRTHLLIAFDTAQTPPAVRAGIVFEYYPASRCGLLTYLAVEPGWRRRGLARRLVNAALEILKRDAEDQGKALRAVFAEAEDPAKVPTGGTAMAPQARLTALTRLGALWIDIPYVQPALQGGSGPCRHLLLLSFYHDGRQPDRIAGAVIREFLHEFYRALGVQRPESNADYAEATQQLEGILPLKPYPLTTTE
ncbi:MAG: GNAT family N-acetyltransferase [Thiohalobacteraceae bacterium]